MFEIPPSSQFVHKSDEHPPSQDLGLNFLDNNFGNKPNLLQDLFNEPSCIDQSQSQSQNVAEPSRVEQSQSQDLVILANSVRLPSNRAIMELDQEYSNGDGSEDDDMLSLNELLPQTQVEATQHPNSTKIVSVFAQLQSTMPDYKNMTLAELKVIRLIYY
jgi:hypothetical protein